jgi:hypothetical protein
LFLNHFCQRYSIGDVAVFCFTSAGAADQCSKKLVAYSFAQRYSSDETEAE